MTREFKLPPLPLEDIEDGEIRVWTTKHLQAYVLSAIEAYKADQAKQEPVGRVVWAADVPNTFKEVRWSDPFAPPVGTVLYTHPAPAPLSGEQIEALFNGVDSADKGRFAIVSGFARAIERAHGIRGEK